MLSWIEIDHSYSKHWSERYLTNTSHVLPLKTILLVDEELNASTEEDTGTSFCPSWKKIEKSESGSTDGSDSEIDVCEVQDMASHIGSSSWHCAEQKARTQMNECERHVTSTQKMTGNGQDRESYWEDNIDKSQWNITERKLFNKTIKVLEEEKLARLAYKGNANDLVLRRLSVDRSAARLRSALVDVKWKLKLSQWLHTLLMENLPPTLLSYYLDIMQTLRSKVPALVERMIMSQRDSNATAPERLNILLKRPWDPAVTAVVSNMKQKPLQPVLFVVVHFTATQYSNPASSWRLRFWNSLLSQVGKVVQITTQADEGADAADEKAPLTIEEVTSRSFKTVSKKVKDLSNRHPNRKVILIGWHTSSIINCHVALKEEVSAVVCLGFPLFTMFGKRGSIDDILCELTTPTFFVVGDRASFCDVNDLEDARERTFTDVMTSSLVVGGADDLLRVSESRKRKCFKTQCMVDRQILEGICDFLHTVFLPPSERQKAFQSNHVAESALSRKRPQSTGDIRASFELKRLRSSSPLVTTQRHSSNPTPTNQQSSGQKKPGENATSEVEGLSFNLQTGSISSLSSVPAPTSEITRSLSADVLSKSRLSSNAAKRKHKAQSQSSLSRSITIDLTKDPNAQLSSAMSKRKSQLLQPTESQTEAAVAAILGGAAENADKPAPSEGNLVSSTTTSVTSSSLSQTAVMAPSTSLGRYASANTAVKKERVKETTTSTQSGFSLTLGSNIGDISSSANALSSSSKLKTGFRPVRGGINRFHSVDQSSVLASRSRKEDRETQQATAILEQLTSSFNAVKDTSSRPSSPETFGKEFTSKRGRLSRSGSLSSIRSDRFDSPRNGKTVSTLPRNPTGRVRTRGSRRSGPRPTDNRSQKALTVNQAAVRRVLSSSGGKGVAMRGGGDSSRRIKLMSDQDALTIFSKPSKSTSRSGPPLVLAPSSQKSKVIQLSGTKPHKDHRVSPLSELIVGSHGRSHASSVSHSSNSGKITLTSSTSSIRSISNQVHSKLRTSTDSVASKPLVQSSSSRPVIYVREKAHVLNPNQRVSTVVKQQTLTASGSKTIASLVTATSSGERALLSITRPRSSSAGVPQGAKIVPISGKLSNTPTSEKLNSSSLLMPSLVLTKISNESIAKTSTSTSETTTMS